MQFYFKIFIFQKYRTLLFLFFLIITNYSNHKISSHILARNTYLLVTEIWMVIVGWDRPKIKVTLFTPP